MDSSIIWIDYYPRLYQDLLQRVFERISQKRAICNVSVMAGPLIDGLNEGRKVRVALVSPDRLISNLIIIQNRLSADTKLIAFPPKGRSGYVYHMHSQEWQLFSPFELSHLLLTVYSTPGL